MVIYIAAPNILSATALLFFLLPTRLITQNTKLNLKKKRRGKKKKQSYSNHVAWSNCYGPNSKWSNIFHRANIKGNSYNGWFEIWDMNCIDGFYKSWGWIFWILQNYWNEFRLLNLQPYYLKDFNYNYYSDTIQILIMSNHSKIGPNDSPHKTGVHEVWIKQRRPWCIVNA